MKKKANIKRNIPRKKHGAHTKTTSDWLESIEQHYDEKQSATNREETKTLRKAEREVIGDTVERGRVICSAARAWIVLPDASETTVVCVAAGIVRSLHSDSSLIAVGDSVQFIRNSISESLIVSVGERKTKLARRGVGKYAHEQVIISNADQLLIVMAAAEPFYNRRLIDRYLIAAEKGGLDPIICVNKIELMPEDKIRPDFIAYKKLKIPVIFTSAATGIGIDELRAILQGKITAFSGPSGVGKSSLTNRLLGCDIQIAKPLNAKFGKGRHVTTAAEMFALPEGGFIVDTPGLRELAIWDLSREETPFYFHDFDRYFLKCKFNSCTHLHEPDCAVRRAAETGRIDPQRYQSYVNIVESIDPR